MRRIFITITAALPLAVSFALAVGPVAAQTPDGRRPSVPHEPEAQAPVDSLLKEAALRTGLCKQHGAEMLAFAGAKPNRPNRASFPAGRDGDAAYDAAMQLYERNIAQWFVRKAQLLSKTAAHQNAARATLDSLSKELKNTKRSAATLDQLSRARDALNRSVAGMLKSHAVLQNA